MERFSQRARRAEPFASIWEARELAEDAKGFGRGDVVDATPVLTGRGDR